MLRAVLRTLAFLPAFALASCAAGDPSVEPLGEDEEEIFAGYQSLAGTYTAEPKSAGDFSRLVIETDGTFHAARLVYCFAAPCPRTAEEGQYRLLRRGAGAYISLAGNQGAGLYQYVERGNRLYLRAVTEGARWQSLGRTWPAWCAEPLDCAMQRLPTGPCVGHWDCAQMTCSFECGFGPPWVSSAE